VAQILRSMATARDGRKKIIAQIMFLAKNVKICNNFFSFLPTLNQYFPHISYVASKNSKTFLKKCKHLG
jgi:hypothetical protein